MTNEEKLLEELKKLDEEREKKEREQRLIQEERDKKLDEELWKIKKKREEEIREIEGEEEEERLKREKKEKDREVELKKRKENEEKENERLSKLGEENQKRREPQNLPKKFYASLLAPIGSTAVNTDSETIPVFYVIIGRGPAAIINHTTLRQTEFGKKRIAGLPVMHIGFANPWTKYMHHGMGQPPHLLNLPGFEKHPSLDAVYDAGLDSQHFGKCVESEYARLEQRYEGKVLTREEWVVWVQSWRREPLGADTEEELGKDGMPPEFIDLISEKLCEEFDSKIATYRLLVMKPKPGKELKKEDIEFIYASHIDICTGPGRPIVMPPGKGDTDECKKARTAAWLSPETWKDGWGEELKARIVLNGVDSIRDEITWKAGERVCVTAGGGVGLNAAERARNDNCKLDWFGRTTLMETFGNPRNDTILRHPTENRLLNPGESKKVLNWTKDDQIIPCKNDLRYGYGATLDNVEIDNSKVKVTLKAGNTAKIKDFFNKQVEFLGTTMWNFSPEYEDHIKQKPSEIYDRLVIPNGQASKSLGHAYYFARHLGLTPLTNGLQMIGLKTGDGRIRVLGAAAQTYDGYGFGQRNITTYFGEKMWMYWDSLPVSAVPDGFIFSGINIAVANEFFTAEKPNKNLTTASDDEIKQILKPKFDILEAIYIAKVIIENRRRPNNNGYESMEKVIEALKNDERTKEIPSIESITKLFDVSYTKSEKADLLDDV